MWEEGIFNMKIVVSIPVHEKPEVINNQIDNFNHYIDNVYIVLHISKSFFETYSLDEIVLKENVYVNPTHLDTKWADIIQAHISNFHFICSVLEFDYFVLHASNDMYIKKGFSQYIENYDAGFNIHKIIKKDSHWWPGRTALEDTQLSNMMNAIGQTMVIASQIESSFFKKGIMGEIVDVIEQNYDANQKKALYSREEIYFYTIASNIVSWSNIGYPTTFSEVHRFDRSLWKLRDITRCIYYNSPLKFILSERVYYKIEAVYNEILFRSRFYKTTCRIIKKILRDDQKYIKKNSFLNDGTGEFRLYNQYIFSVKRITRNINDPVRKFISNLP